MKKALLVHHNFNKPGGAERVALSMVKVLNGLNYEVCLLTFYKPAESYGNLFSNIHFLTRFSSGPATTYSCSFLDAISTVTKVSKKYDLIVNNAGMYTPFFAADLVYVHAPYFYDLLVNSPSILDRAYGAPLTLLRNLLDLFGIESKVRLIAFNSIYTKEKSLLADSLCKKHPNVILYPPVNAHSISFFASTKKPKKENSLVMVSRINVRKNVENVFELMSRLPPEIKVTIIGGVDDQVYFEYLLKKCRKLDLSGRVSFKTNISEREKLDILSKAKVYFHATRGEYFGISIVEAMAAGAIPIVHNSGGPIEFVPLEFRYEDMDNAALMVCKAFESWNSKLEARLLEVALGFDESQFENGFQQCIQQIA